MGRRCFDVVASLCGLLMLAPLLLWIGRRIRKEDSGSVFYRGERVGMEGRTFRIFKFRTMIVDADKTGVSSTSDEDPRITNTGRFLRKHKLDELPQLINVLKGEMSLVGPRPEVARYVDMMTKEERGAILSVRPGITDWASLWNNDEGAVLAGSSDPEKAYLEEIRPEKIRLQLKYVQEHSFWIDLRIILRTILAIIR